MTTETIEMTAVERAQANLRDAIAGGNAKRIDRAAKQLEQAREDADREAMRRKDRRDAQLLVDQEKRDRERIERQQRADAGEAALRATTPTIAFEACGRRVTVIISVAGVETGWAVEAVRRLAWGATRSFAERVVASRNLGAAAPESDWLTPLLNDQSHGIEIHIRRGVVRVEEIK